MEWQNDEKYGNKAGVSMANRLNILTQQRFLKQKQTRANNE